MFRLELHKAVLGQKPNKLFELHIFTSMIQYAKGSVSGVECIRSYKRHVRALTGIIFCTHRDIGRFSIQYSATNYMLMGRKQPPSS